MDDDVIVASSDSEGIPEDIPPEAQAYLFPAVNVQDVQVFIPMDNGVPLQLLPDDIQEDELMDQDDPDFLNQQMDLDVNANGLNGNNLRNVGFAQLQQPNVDFPCFDRHFQLPQPKSDFFKHNPKAIRLWAKCFAPGPGAPTIHIPQKWVDFFTLLLASPTALSWASSILGSAAFAHLQDQSSSEAALILFCLPQSQPQMDLLACSKNLPSSVEYLESQLPVEDFNSLSSSAHSPSSAADLASPATPP
jgi:hypothetical protein